MTSEPIPTPENELTQHIADTLQERNHSLIKKIVYTIGVERTQEFLQKTLEIEAAGGQKTASGARRRSPGGVFFYLVRTGLPKEERKQIWSNARNKKQIEVTSESPSTEKR